MADAEARETNEPDKKDDDAFTRVVALMIAVYAVVLAVTALGGSSAGEDMLMAQQKASNAWSYYQAKVVRENLYVLAAKDLEMQLADLADEPNANPKKKERREKAKSDYEKKAAEYTKEKEEIMAEARDHEKERDISARRGPYFDSGEVLLQIAIVLASVAVLSGKRTAFYLSIVFALVGTFMCVDGYTLFVAIPGLE
jgi:hypothetical protein